MDAKKKPSGTGKEKVKAALAKVAEPGAGAGDVGGDAGMVPTVPPGDAAGEVKIPSRGYAAAIPYAVAALAIEHGYDPSYLMAWSYWDGKAVIIGPDGKKFRET
jgi:hypothetical protein